MNAHRKVPVRSPPPLFCLFTSPVLPASNRFQYQKNKMQFAPKSLEPIISLCRTIQSNFQRGPVRSASTTVPQDGHRRRSSAWLAPPPPGPIRGVRKHGARAALPPKPAARARWCRAKHAEFRPLHAWRCLYRANEWPTGHAYTAQRTDDGAWRGCLRSEMVRVCTVTWRQMQVWINVWVRITKYSVKAGYRFERPERIVTLAILVGGTRTRSDGNNGGHSRVRSPINVVLSIFFPSTLVGFVCSIPVPIRLQQPRISVSQWHQGTLYSTRRAIRRMPGSIFS